MDFLIITGMSGAGKSRVNSNLEDMGYYCVDNMPAVLSPQFASLCLATRGRYERVALVTDVRGGASFDVLFESLQRLEEMKCLYRILFVEAAVEVLIRRYKETRRSHPLASLGLGLEQAILREREMLEPLRQRAHYILNTSALTTAQLRGEVLRLFAHDAREGMAVQVVSFGYKYGIPLDADLVFDVRFLPNPYYLEQLKPLSGLDEPVRNFVFSYNQTQEFMQMLEAMIAFLLPMYLTEGKTSLVVAVGCTGGRHRSVCVAEELGEFIRRKDYSVDVKHLHIDK